MFKYGSCHARLVGEGEKEVATKNRVEKDDPAYGFCKESKKVKSEDKHNMGIVMTDHIEYYKSLAGDGDS